MGTFLDPFILGIFRIAMEGDVLVSERRCEKLMLTCDVSRPPAS